MIATTAPARRRGSMFSATLFKLFQIFAAICRDAMRHQPTQNIPNTRINR
jgi:hypothetical protein